MVDAVAHEMGKFQNSHPLRNTSYHFNNQKRKKTKCSCRSILFSCLTFFFTKNIVIIDSKDSRHLSAGSRLYGELVESISPAEEGSPRGRFFGRLYKRFFVIYAYKSTKIISSRR